MLIVRLDSERQKLSSAMQSLLPSVVGRPVVHVDRAVDSDIPGRTAQACHLGVVAHLEGQRVGGRAVGAGLEQQRVPLGAELVGDLLVGDRVHRGLDLTLRHARGEDIHVRAEAGLARQVDRGADRGRGGRLGGGRFRGGSPGRCGPGGCGGQPGGAEEGRGQDRAAAEAAGRAGAALLPPWAGTAPLPPWAGNVPCLAGSCRSTAGGSQVHQRSVLPVAPVLPRSVRHIS